MSQRIDSYNAYLKAWSERNPNVVEPSRQPLKSLKGCTLRLVSRAGKKITHTSCYVYQDENDRVIELAGSGDTQNVYVFPTKGDWHNYKKPDDFNSFHEIW